MISRLARISGQLLLSSAAVIGACCLVITVAGALFGVRPLIFRSGSMSPTITAGSLAIARPVDADRLRIGDIVSVPVDDTRVAHRITDISRHPGGATLQLKGDANPVPDPQRYRVTRADKIIFAVPDLGSVVAWSSRAPGIFVLAGYAALMVALLVRRRPAAGSDDHDRRPRPGRRGRVLHPRRRPALLQRRTIAAAAVLGTLALIQTPASWASFTDTATLTQPTAAISTATVPAPVVSCGLLAVGSVTLNWAAVPGATDYTVYSGTTALGNTSGATSYKITGGLISSGTATVVAHHDYGSTTWDSQPSNPVSYTILVLAVAACNLL